MQANDLITLDSVVVGYASRVAGPVSFTLSKGQAIGLAGPNGAGKSTLLKSVNGELPIISGEIHRNSGLKTLRMSQESSWPEELPLSVQEWFEVSGGSTPWNLEQLKHLRRKRLDQLSGGERQLIRLAAFLFQPVDLLLLDEPTNHLDKHHRFLLMDLLEGVSESMGLLLVSHDRGFLKGASSHLLEIQA